AGTPLVSDPGFEIVQRAIALGMKVVPVPGPSAHLLALVASGLPCKRFAFEGFLPERKADRLGRLAELKVEKRTMIFYVAPHDLTHLLEELLLVLGNRPACLAREITKVHEEFLRGSLSLLSELVGKRQIRGECTLVVAGMPYVGEEKPDWTQVLEELSEQMSKGLRLKEASQAVATKYKVPKSKVYKLGLTLLKE
ncbi:MAG: 16S rRNA (cytidine(1402)-2'-O)-methyltransferase, partial [Candidatus Melainabacteria bacterium]|nr:16S rRNA (cytidine(1402)-2'-O)-methyltransferase [Candidatus Melainabacteria bacterium]